jgi:hypothetical protein
MYTFITIVGTIFFGVVCTGMEKRNSGEPIWGKYQKSHTWFFYIALAITSIGLLGLNGAFN